jgi:small subunit ribosomal protein S8
MVMTDPIADFLTRIRNANTVYHDKVEAPASRMKKAIAAILRDEGFVREYEYIDDGKQGIIRVYLKYGANKGRVITGLKRISKPGLRVYARKDDVPKVLGGLGIAIISTSKGIMTDKKPARKGLAAK